jgi:predicted alpha/beta hydrolase family esterase
MNTSFFQSWQEQQLCAVLISIIFLESLSGNQNVGGVVMVAGFLDDRGDAEISSFFKREFNFETIALRSQRFVSIHSDNDPSLKPRYFKNSHIFLSKLKSKIVVIPDGGHFSLADNCFEFPEVVDEVINLVK